MSEGDYRSSNIQQIREFCKQARGLWMEYNSKKSSSSNSALQQNVNSYQSNGQEQKHQQKKSNRKHKCSNRCTNQNVRFYVYKQKDGTFHVCLEEATRNVSYCTIGGSPEDHCDCTLHIEHLWICKRSENFHLCGVHCDNIFNEQNPNLIVQNESAMCQITGLWMLIQKDGSRQLYGTSSIKIEDARMKSWMIQAVDMWKKYVYKGWAPVDSAVHTCRTGREDFRHDEELEEKRRIMKGIPHANAKKTSELIKEGQYKSCTIVNIPTSVYSVNSGLDYHVCLGMHCSAIKNNPGLHEGKAIVLDNVHVCKETGIPHLCGQYCKTNLRNQDGISVCELTGKCIDQVLIKDTWNANGAHIMTPKDSSYSTSCSFGSDGVDVADVTGKRFSNPYKMDMELMMLSGNENFMDVFGDSTGDAFSHSSTSTSSRKSKIDIANKKQECLMIAVSKIMKLFSDDQNESEFERMENTEKEIDSQFTKYITKNTQSKNLVVLTDVYVLSVNHQKKKDDVIAFSLSESEKQTIATTYAQQCLILWFIVRTRTKLGKDKPNLFPFKEFVYPALTLFESGFEIPEADLGYRATIIEPDPLFEARSPDLDKLSNYTTSKGSTSRKKNKGKNESSSSSSSSYNTPPPLKKRRVQHSGSAKVPRFNIRETRRKTQYEKIRKNIEKALTNAVRMEDTPPEHLRLSSVDFDQIDPSNEIFSYSQYRNNSSAMIAAKKQEQLRQITMVIPTAIEVQSTIEYSTTSLPELPAITSVPYSLIKSTNMNRITFSSNSILDRLIECDS